jgi:hypothetical protein
MSVFKRPIFYILICFFALPTLAHGQEKKIVQFSGFFQKESTLDPVPFVSIRNKTFQGQEFQGNHQGYFSFVAHEGDTIVFSSIGYFTKEYVIPPTFHTRHTAEILLKEQVVMLDPVEIFPWASVEEFTQAFINLTIADDDIAIAKRNLSMESIRNMAAVTPRNANEMYQFNTTQRHIEMSNKAVNQRMNNPLLSPLAWGTFIQQITEGNKSRAKNKW